MQQIKLDDIKRWLADLYMENRILQEELERLRGELEEFKRALEKKEKPPEGG